MNKKSRKINKRLVILISALIFCATSYALFYFFRKNTSDTDVTLTDESSELTSRINYSEPSSGEKSDSKRNKDEVINNMDKPVISEQTNTNAPISISITRATRNIVSAYIERVNEGICSLSIKQNSQVKISMSSKVIALADYSTCEGFSIDSTLLEPTKFIVNLTVTSGSRKGSASQEVN